MHGECWSVPGSLSAEEHCISVLGWPGTKLIRVAAACGAKVEWTCISGKMSHLGFGTLWCLKHPLKCDTPSTYLLAAHSNLSAGLWREAFQEILRGVLMWRGAPASTRLHETVRHTWQIDLDSSNSFSVVLSSAVWNMSSRKKSVFLFFWACVPACLARHFAGALWCLLFFFFSVFSSFFLL